MDLFVPQFCGRAGHNWRQFDKSTINLSIDIVVCRLSLETVLSVCHFKTKSYHRQIDLSVRIFRMYCQIII
jgi:hypothetical protein